MNALSARIKKKIIISPGPCQMFINVKYSKNIVEGTGSQTVVRNPNVGHG